MPTTLAGARPVFVFLVEGLSDSAAAKCALDAVREVDAKAKVWRDLDCPRLGVEPVTASATDLVLALGKAGFVGKLQSLEGAPREEWQPLGADEFSEGDADTPPLVAESVAGVSPSFSLLPVEALGSVTLRPTRTR